jgi:hypothetical protein
MAPKNNEKKTSEKEILKQMNEPPFPLYVDAKLPSFREGWESVVRLLRGRKNIVVLTGAGKFVKPINQSIDQVRINDISSIQKNLKLLTIPFRNICFMRYSRLSEQGLGPVLYPRHRRTRFVVPRRHF